MDTLEDLAGDLAEDLAEEMGGTDRLQVGLITVPMLVSVPADEVAEAANAAMSVQESGLTGREAMAAAVVHSKGIAGIVTTTLGE